MKKRITLLKRFDHFVGNGTHVHYAPGDTGEFPENLANALVYEGLGTPASEETEEQKSEGDAPANKAKKAAPENKAKK